MKRDIDRGLYIEHGRHDGDLYGIYKADVLALARQGKTCILDIQPQVPHARSSECVCVFV